MDELKPCPFCGGEAETGKTVFGLRAGLIFVFCKKCYASSLDYKTEKEAIKVWNRRVNDAT